MIHIDMNYVFLFVVFVNHLNGSVFININKVQIIFQK